MSSHILLYPFTLPLIKNGIYYNIDSMSDWSGLGKFFIFLGLFLILIGLIINFLPKVPFLGKLPGDIVVKRDNFTFYFPLGTSLLLSILLTLLLNLLLRK